MPGLNLLPWREQQLQAGIRRMQLALFGVGLMAVLVTVLTDYLGRQVQQRHVVEHAAIRLIIDGLDSQLAQVAQHKIEQEQIQDRLQALESLQGKRVFLVDLLEQLERVVPPGVQLTALTRQGARLHVHGLAHSGSLVAQLLRNLSCALVKAELQHMKAVDEGEMFELSVTLRGEP
ncbi:type IV fimbrial biogenesis protein PilN [Pseudomonas alkylphenolica]|uniref:Type IV fimbrial biogenesis protein PilN n=1 Tax=Pseudomonas alkylphenolica TaxID=237609 RepID=A0A077FF62_9PSED|nr:type IV fimbrial biogenesis protein PilN [Pseudomonas alkylphenolica]